MRKFIIICCFCSFSFGVLPVIDAGLIAALASLQAAFDEFSLSAKRQWAKEQTQWSRDNEFYKNAIEKYKEILKAITEKKSSINALNTKEKQTYKLLVNIGNITNKIMENRDLKGLSDSLEKESKSKVVSKDYKIEYCQKLKNDKAKYACYADFGSAAISLILQDKSADDMKKFNEAIEAINSARSASQDIKESADIANVIAQEHLELATYKAQKTAAQKALKEKKELEMIAAKRRTLDKINTKLDMSKIVKQK